MSNTGRPSTIRNHPAREEIERALDAGEPYASVCAKFNLSKSALSRFNLSRKPLKRIFEDEPNVTTILPRLVQIADDAQSLRVLTKLNGTPPARARAMKVELDTLSILAERLGLDDTSVTEFVDETLELVHAIRELSQTEPEATRALLRVLERHGSVSYLTGALRAQLKQSKKETS
jgi:hypothetical protein